MNEHQLDAELQELFAEGQLDIDPQAPAALALYKRITTPASGVVPDSSQMHDPVDPIEAEIVDLADADKSDRHRYVAIVAACVLFIMVLGLGIWNVFDVTAGPVLTDETVGPIPADDANGGFFEDADLIVAPGVPAITISRGNDVSSQAVEGCVETIADFASRRGGSEPLTFVASFAATDAFNAQVVIGAVANCTVEDLGFSLSGAGPTVLQRELESFEVRIEGSGGQSSELSEGAAAWSIVNLDGLVGEDVVGVRVLDPEPVEQLFRTVGSTFLLNALYADGGFPEVSQIEVTFEGGQVVVGAPTNFSGRDRASFSCEAVETCISDRLQDLAAGAIAARHDAQAEILADGELTQTEYDQALEAFEQCLASFSDGPIETPTVLADGSADARNAQSCFLDNLEFVDAGRIWHNQVALLGSPEFVIAPTDPRPNPDEEPDAVGDEEVATEVAIPDNGDFEWADAALQLFEDGLSGEELDATWDGFPFLGRKAELLADYQLRFQWVQTDTLSFSLNNYAATDPQGTSTPILTVQSLEDPSRVAAFVLGVDSSDAVFIRRLPDSGATSRFVSQVGRLLTHSGSGTTGPPAVFGDFFVATDTSLENFDTSISLPADYDGRSPLTIVAPTNDVPVAIAIVPDLVGE